MKGWSAERLAEAAGAALVRGRPGEGPARASIDSRSVGDGDLFVGIAGERVDGGAFAADALRAGAWGVLVTPEWAAELTASDGAILSATDPVAALGALARAWRRELGADVVAVTGSAGKTTTKDLIAGLIAPHRAAAVSRENYNTEIGLPLEVLAAPAGTEVLVLELAMRGFGQIAELTAICEPDVGVITNIGPAHLEQVGDLEGVARAKGELLAGMRDGGTAVVPAGDELLTPLLRPGIDAVTFGPGGDVDFAGGEPAAGRRQTILAGGEPIQLELPFTQHHNLLDTLAAVAAARAVGVAPSGRVDIRFSALRGERVALPIGAVVVNDCYNANPLSMAAALEDLASGGPEGRRVAVLGDMLELGADARALHREVGAQAARAGVDVLVAVGPLAEAMPEAFHGESFAVPDAAAAAELARSLVAAGDVVLVKASRGVGLEVVTEALLAAPAASPRGGPG